MMAKDGHFYEKTQIKKWFKTRKTSPITNEIISTELSECYVFNSMLEKFLETNPCDRINQFSTLKNYLEHKDKVVNIIQNKLFDKLIQYNNFSMMKIIDDELMEKLLSCKNDNIIKHIIDNAFDLNCEDSDDWKFIHYVTKYSNLEIIKHLINKNISLECQTIDKWRPLHFACRFSTSDVIKYLFDADIGLDLECETKNGWKPIHFICNYQDSDIIKFVISENIDIESRIQKYNNKNENYGVKELVIVNKKILRPEEKLELLDLFDKKIKIKSNLCE
jgi:ankyrin repeat protein